MICPACKNPLREKSAGGITLDTCYGGCGGIWFDAGEFSRIYEEILKEQRSLLPAEPPPWPRLPTSPVRSAATPACSPKPVNSFTTN